jgi:hypothetical protein
MMISLGRHYRALLGLCSLAIAPAQLLSQSDVNTNALTTSTLQAQLDVMKLSSRLRLQTAGGRQEGRLSFRTADSLGVRELAGGETRVPLMAVDSMWVRGHRTGLGFLVGTLVGAAGYVVVTSAINGDDESDGMGALDNLFGGGVWVGSALVGTIVGALSSHWKRVHPD